MAEPDPSKQAGFSLSFDSLADELEGKEKTAPGRNLAENLYDVVYGGQTGGLHLDQSADFSLFGRRIAKDVRVDLGNGCGKIHHASGDLTIFSHTTSFTQTTDQGGFFRVGQDPENQVIFHLRTDGDIDVLAPGFDDTLHRLTAGSGVSVWRNESGTISITLNEATGQTDLLLSL
jgi:hypothetical protein